GAEAAVELAAAGATVLLVARSEDKLGAVRAAIRAAGGTAHAHPADLSDGASVEGLVSGVLDRHGGVDVVVNNAGHSIRRSVALSYGRFHDYERTMAVNYFGPVRLVLGLLPSMRERRRGQLVNVSSLGVLIPAP